MKRPNSRRTVRCSRCRWTALSSIIAVSSKTTGRIGDSGLPSQGFCLLRATPAGSSIVSGPGGIPAPCRWSRAGNLHRGGRRPRVQRLRWFGFSINSKAEKSPNRGGPRPGRCSPWTAPTASAAVARARRASWRSRAARVPLRPCCGYRRPGRPSRCRWPSGQSGRSRMPRRSSVRQPAIDHLGRGCPAAAGSISVLRMASAVRMRSSGRLPVDEVVAEHFTAAVCSLRSIRPLQPAPSGWDSRAHRSGTGSSSGPARFGPSPRGVGGDQNPQAAAWPGSAVERPA